MSQTNSSMSDQAFAKKAAPSNPAEEKLGELAEQNGQSQKVRQFGRKMATDHSNANEQLKTAASEENINLPTQPSAKQRDEYQWLSKLSDKGFDRAYARLMLRDHEPDGAASRESPGSEKNQQIKNWASLTLPTLEDHLKLARQMYYSAVGSSTTRTGSSGSGR